MAVYLGSNKVSCMGGQQVTTHGIDTTDATATAFDMSEYVTAYANGEKIAGELLDYRNIDEYNIPTLNGACYATNADGDTCIAFNIDDEPGVIFNANTGLHLNCKDIVEEIGLTPDMIVAGNTILGIEGIAVCGSEKHIELKLTNYMSNGNIDFSKMSSGNAYINVSTLFTRYRFVCGSATISSRGNENIAPKVLAIGSLDGIHGSYGACQFTSSGSLDYDSSAIRHSTNGFIWSLDPYMTTLYDTFELTIILEAIT